jgi:putative GTP pyrophosphokinase
MKRKQYDLNYKSLIENVQDIAGIRVVCQFKSDIPKIIEIIEENPNLEILEKRDYIKSPKKSGYSGYHIIAQTPVNIGETFANVKTEIQIRTMAMDFWSSTEHKIKYKAKSKLSKSDSKKMVKYAKLINKLDSKITQIHNKYEN